ncbi:MAG: hypothetical protein EOO09_09510 [Chitinophagaceae bacterium]|nr:MAG: hypothetical protein EOO09_09510 [Chitinophagaceae bacterium]
MRFIIFVLTCSVIIMVSCSRKSTPAIAVNTVAKDTIAPQPPAPETLAGAGISIRKDTAVATPPVKIEPVTGSMFENEAGRVIYVTKCAKCHEAKPVDHWNQTDWQPILKSMIKKSRLDSTENFQVRLYVNTHAKKD